MLKKMLRVIILMILMIVLAAAVNAEYSLCGNKTLASKNSAQTKGAKLNSTTQLILIDDTSDKIFFYNASDENVRNLSLPGGTWEDIAINRSRGQAWILLSLSMKALLVFLFRLSLLLCCLPLFWSR